MKLIDTLKNLSIFRLLPCLFERHEWISYSPGSYLEHRCARCWKLGWDNRHVWAEITAKMRAIRAKEE